jgi:hypothetical protein
LGGGGGGGRGTARTREPVAQYSGHGGGCVDVGGGGGSSTLHRHTPAQAAHPPALLLTKTHSSRLMLEFETPPYPNSPRYMPPPRAPDGPCTTPARHGTSLPQAGAQQTWNQFTPGRSTADMDLVYPRQEHSRHGTSLPQAGAQQTMRASPVPATLLARASPRACTAVVDVSPMVPRTKAVIPPPSPTGRPNTTDKVRCHHHVRHAPPPPPRNRWPQAVRPIRT